MCIIEEINDDEIIKITLIISITKSLSLILAFTIEKTVSGNTDITDRGSKLFLNSPIDM